MKAPRKLQIAVGVLIFAAGLVLETGAILSFLSKGYAAVVPASPFTLHISAAVLIAVGAALAVTARVGLVQALGLSAFFATLTLILPAIGPLAILIFASVLAWHSWHHIPKKIKLTKIPEPDASSIDQCPINEPLVGLLKRIPAEDLQQALLGMSNMPPRETRPLLKALQKHDDVRVLLYANGLLNDHLNMFEKRLAGLQKQLKSDPNDEVILTALVETYASLIEHKLIPADEAPQTAKRALALAETALAINPGNAPVLVAKARFELLIADFQAAYATIQALYPLPDSFETARVLHAELNFEHAATRPVRPIRPSRKADRRSHHSVLN
jgi:tetratricopeptide (TPR) repeat protein